MTTITRDSRPTPDLAAERIKTPRAADLWLVQANAKLQEIGFVPSDCPNSRIADKADWQTLQRLPATRKAAAAAQKIAEATLETGQISIESALKLIDKKGVALSQEQRRWLTSALPRVVDTAPRLPNAECFLFDLTRAIFHAELRPK